MSRVSTSDLEDLQRHHDAADHQMLQALSISPSGADGSDDSVDAIIELVQQRPEETLRFLKIVMLLGSVSSLVVAVPSGVCLSVNWELGSLCARPLQWWLLVNFAFQVFQCPLRCFFFYKLLRIRRDDDILEQDGILESRQVDLEHVVTKMITSMTWKCSKLSSMMSYLWMAVGVVWLMNSGRCVECPGLFDMCIFACLTAIVRVCMSAAAYHFYFLSATGAVQAQQEMKKPRAASQELIDSLPLICFNPELGADDTWENGCSICLSEFEAGDLLRKLPCGHRFHGQCVDTWLCRNRKCPLCNHSVDTPMMHCVCNSSVPKTKFD